MRQHSRFLRTMGTISFLFGVVLAIFGIPLLLASAQLLGAAVAKDQEAHDAAL